MKSLKSFRNIYLCRGPVDFRKGMRSLAQLVESEMQLSPLDPSLFVFINRAKDRIRLLYWDRNGFAMWQKILERDKYHWPTHLSGQNIQLSEKYLDWLLKGLNLAQLEPHKSLEYQSTY